MIITTKSSKMSASIAIKTNDNKIIDGNNKLILRLQILFKVPKTQKHQNC